MNNVLKKLVHSENRRFLFLIIVFVLSLILSAVIYLIAGEGGTANISYDSISTMEFSDIFIKTLKRNIIYFTAVIFLTIMGQDKIIIALFALTSTYYGLSIIYLIRALRMDKIYFIMTFTDYFIFFPILFYFTFISNIISKYTKKSKKIETISHKFDIIVTGYIKISLRYLLIVTAYSLGYSYYILFLSRLLVK
jgi:hypothetical protein